MAPVACRTQGFLPGFAGCKEDQFFRFPVEMDDLQDAGADFFPQLGQFLGFPRSRREGLLEGLQIGRQLIEQRLATVQQVRTERTLLFLEELILLQSELVEIVADLSVTLQDFAHGGM